VTPVLLAGIAAALWIGVLNKVVQLWRAPEDLPLRALAACVVSATLTFTVNLPPLRPLLDHTGAGVRSLVINFGTMAAAYFLLVFFTYSMRGPAARHTVRRQAVPLAAAILVAFAAWALAPPAVRADPADTINGASPHATVFVVAVLGYMAHAHSRSLRWSIAYVRVARSPRLRRGLVVVSVAVCAFLVADVTKTLLALLQAVTQPPAGAVRVFHIVHLSGVGVGALAFVVGVSYAAVVGMIVSLPLWRAHRRRYHQLEPLWAAVDQAFPELVLGRVPATSWRGRLGWDSAHYRYYRRVVEIRDGLVLLGPYYDPTRTERQTERDEVHWAGLIRDALRAKQAGSPVSEADPVLVPGGDDLESDAAVLAGISRELALDGAGTAAVRDTAAGAGPLSATP
jgi:hypothetical protein